MRFSRKNVGENREHKERRELKTLRRHLKVSLKGSLSTWKEQTHGHFWTTCEALRCLRFVRTGWPDRPISCAELRELLKTKLVIFPGRVSLVRSTELS